ncbi:FadR/GntR family transcriptional regulator [Clostridium gasigenes]|uniref:FadR/GntR family transcriptional regulator n=1 Tax=Clostridium gasigenes TaxID=94869 RepID=UPI00143860CF|nr:FadR/GntR family transcriptional regulator [Clostridium gasigenes]MBB6625303.1 FadR family transcriptional regulator [Clostridium gasigenes]MBU3105002.1 FadR family transcriptional regulator [Clostridium gasigenes]MBU3107451.1 FadR family transcriptional regulator [Clostridium gasigenes]MBU3132697.1 FadR family transcriptional regulator [Clostridium gasigenes]MBU3135373.1 FadR family transcriptional regulator [Clostridium gasigenes]
MFTEVKNMKVYEQIINQFKDMIAKGLLKKGDKLPSERELVSQLGVSRTGIREALSALQMIGLVESRHGEGNYIKDNLEDSLKDPFLLIFMLNGGKFHEILEFRKGIEIETAALAANKIQDDEIVILKDILHRLDNAECEEVKVKLDKELHYLIAKASKNILIVNLLNVNSSLMDIFISEARGKILSKEENRECLLKQHKDIVDAISNHDSSSASKAMRRHLDFIEKYIYNMK